MFWKRSGHPGKTRSPTSSDISLAIGDVDEHDRHENELSFQRGWRLLSSYTLSTGVKFWIITEADGSVTTFLLPDEY